MMVKRSVILLFVAFFVVALALGRELLVMLRDVELRSDSTVNFVAVCPSIDTTANHIIDPNGVLRSAMHRLATIKMGKAGTLSVLHIGDSHVQCDKFTKIIRESLSADFGSSGRGIIMPTSLAGTNGADDYSIKSPNRWQSMRCVERDNFSQIGGPGIGVRTGATDIEFTIDSPEPFSTITVLHHESAPRLIEPEELSTGMNCTADDTDRLTKIVLDKNVRQVSLRGRATAQYNNNTFYGFVLENGESGILYNVAGVNGASFQHFNNDRMVEDLMALRPDILVVSLGTNDSFGGNFAESDVRANLNALISKLHHVGGEIPILLTTPMECYQGGKVNENVAKVAQIMVDYAAQNNLACWDFYSAAGGAGSNEIWLRHDLVSGDMIHLTHAGYQLQGQMLYDALRRYYNQAL